jgi:hypothetical protein
VNEIFAVRIVDAKYTAIFRKAWSGVDARERRTIKVAVIVPFDLSVVSELPVSVHGHAQNDDQEEFH